MFIFFAAIVQGSPISEGTPGRPATPARGCNRNAFFKHDTADSLARPARTAQANSPIDEKLVHGLTCSSVNRSSPVNLPLAGRSGAGQDATGQGKGQEGEGRGYALINLEFHSESRVRSLKGKKIIVLAVAVAVVFSVAAVLTILDHPV